VNVSRGTGTESARSHTEGPDKPLVYLLSGLTGSGKTTFAKALEAAGVVRLSVDEEVFAGHGRYGIDYPHHEYRARERPVVEDIRRRLIDLVHAGRCVVLDYGLWLRSEREDYKRLVQEAGGRRRLIDLVHAGRCVVLDYGLWLRSEREDYKRLVQEAGGRWRLLTLTTTVVNQRSLRRFDVSPRRATPKGQTFISCTAPHPARSPTQQPHLLHSWRT